MSPVAESPDRLQNRTVLEQRGSRGLRSASRDGSVSRIAACSWHEAGHGRHDRGARLLAMPRMIACLAMLVLMTGFVGGCEPDTSRDRAAVERPVWATEPVDIRYRYPDAPPVVDAQGLQDLVREHTRYRYVVLLDFWASWCRRSREEMPSLARLQDELGEDGFAVISCNLDDVQQWANQTIPILRSAGANFPCVVVDAAAKESVRTWLDRMWAYDLPARFVVNSRGEVVARLHSSMSLADAMVSVRQIVRQGGAVATLSALTTDGAALRVKLIDVRRKRWRSLPEVTADPADAARLAEQAAGLLSNQIDRSSNARIAVVAFRTARSRRQAGPFGRQTAEALQDALRQRGYYDLIGLSEADRMIRRLGLTLLDIEFDPSRVYDGADCDYLIVGWLRGDVDADVASESLAADGTNDNPGAEASYENPRDAAP